MILITGSTGYIGSHISLYFEKNNIEFIGIDNLSYSYKSNVSNNQKHFFIDISNKSKIIKIIKKYKPNTVIHCAACSYVIEAESHKKKYLLNNIKKTKKFIDICKENNIKNFIFMSSSNVYKEKNNSSVFFEKDITSPKNFYGKNKINIERYLKKKLFQKLVILRLFNVIGIFNKNFKPFNFKKKNFQRIIFKTIKNIKTNRATNISYYKIKNQKKFPSRDFIDILDLSKILKKLLQNIVAKKKYYNTFNIATGKAISIDKIINLIYGQYKLKPKITYVSLAKKEFIKTEASIKKIKKFINYNKYISYIKSVNSHYIFNR